MFPVHYITYLLKSLEPISLNEPQLKSRLCGLRPRHIPKPQLLDISQALTGLRPHDEVTSQMRSLKNFTAWGRRAEHRARPLAPRQDPPGPMADRRHLPLDLAHRPGASNDPVRIRNMISGVTSPLPPSFLENVADNASLYISLNHDQTGAVVADSKGYSRFNLAALFPDMMSTVTPGLPSMSGPSPATIPGTPASMTTVATPRASRVRSPPAVRVATPPSRMPPPEAPFQPPPREEDEGDEPTRTT